MAVWAAAALCCVVDGFTPKDSMHCVKWESTEPGAPIRSEANHGRYLQRDARLNCDAFSSSRGKRVVHNHCL